MDRVVVIANPVASQFTGGSHRDVMAQLNRSNEVAALWPGSATEATAAAQQAVDDGAAVVVAMGGDGIVHHVAQALVGTETALGIVPMGTTNVVARLFDIPSRPSKAARLIERHELIRAVGTVGLHLNRGDIETVHHAIFACGLGLDAEVVRVADSDPYRKYRFGSIHYARSALSVGVRSFPSVKPHVAITAGEHHLLATTALLQFREVYTYLGKIGLRFASTPPNPMTALVMTRLARRRIPKILFNALTHRDLDTIGGFEVWQDLKRLDITANPPVAFQADGESLGMADRAVVEWDADSLRMVTGAL